jgi:hypothetical protein
MPAFLRSSVLAGDTLTLPFQLIDDANRPLTLARITDATSNFDLYYYVGDTKTYILQGQTPIAQMGGTMRNAVTVSSINGLLRPRIVLPSDHMLPPRSTQIVFVEGTSNAFIDETWVSCQVDGPNSFLLDAQLPSTVTAMQITTGIMSITVASSNIAIQAGSSLRQNQVAYLDMIYDTTLSLDKTMAYEVVRPS